VLAGGAVGDGGLECFRRDDEARRDTQVGQPDLGRNCFAGLVVQDDGAQRNRLAALPGILAQDARFERRDEGPGGGPRQAWAGRRGSKG